MVVEILQILFGGMCVGFAASVTVGPVAVLCIQRTLSKGYLSGFVSGFGVACADTILAILSFTVYAILKSSIDQYNDIIQICGGCFVIIVGIFIFFKNPVPQIRKNRAGKTHLWQDFASMFGFTLANFVFIIPYILAFFTMFHIDLSNKPAEVIATEEVVAIDVEAGQLEPVAEVVVTEEPEVMLHEVEVVADDMLPDEEVMADAKPAKVGRVMNTTLVLFGFLVGATIWWLIVTSLLNLFRRNFRPRHLLTINHVAGLVIGILGLYTLLSVII